MSRTPLRILMWSSEHNCYDLYTQGHLEQQFRPEDQEAWQSWLETATSFAFRGAYGSLNVYREKRSRGGQYWYAYHTRERRTYKRYLGQACVTFARLEETAKALVSESSPPPFASERGPEERDAASHQEWPVSTREVLRGMELLSTKLSPPVLSSRLLVRERLLHRLDAARFHRLTLLSASAGWGKTTLLATWASRSTWPIAWLSLDELDKGPVPFWISVLAALRTCLPGVGKAALSMLRSPQPPPLSAILTTLLNELSRQDTPIFLLLDDYHLIDEQAIHDSVLFLLNHLPAHLHLVLSSRVDPPLMLSRWRVQGQLLELRDANLRFEEEEAVQFLTHTMDLSLEAKEMAELAHRTEGWIAGLQLAALSLTHHPDRAAFVRGFTGGHRYVLDYVQEDILALLSPSIQNFVLSTSILNRLSASLCDAVTVQAASQEVLETLERANLFLVPLDDERQWYRFHDLFREALLARLQAAQPETVPLLHQRAASWYEEQGEFREAISHWLSAHDFLSAVRLMEQAVEEFWLRGEITTIYHGVLALPDTVLCEHARLALNVALQLLQANQYSIETVWHSVRAQAEHLLARLDNLILQKTADVFSEAEAALVRQRIHVLRLYIKLREAIWNNDKDAIHDLDQQMRDLDEDDDILWKIVLLSSQFVLHASPIGDGDTDHLLLLLRPAKQKALAARNHYAAIKLMQWIAHMGQLSGRLHSVFRESLEALDSAKLTSGLFPSVIWLHCNLIFVYYRRNQLEEARALLEKVLRYARDWQNLDMLVSGYTYWIFILLAESNLLGAQQALQELAESFKHQRLLPSYAHFLTWLRLRLCLVSGDLKKAIKIAIHAKISLETNQAEPVEVTYFLAAELARFSLALQQSEEAIQTLTPYLERVEQVQRQDALIHLLAVYSVALYQAGQKEQTRLVAARLFTLTEPEGYIRVYLDMGEPMKQVLKSILNMPKDGEESISRAYISTLLAAFEQEEQRRVAKGEAPQSASSREREAQLPGSASLSDSVLRPAPIEALSPQELRVLRLLVAGRSNREIASDLVVSINTIKAHVKKIYSKLHVSNRVAASEVTRALHLL